MGRPACSPGVCETQAVSAANEVLFSHLHVTNTLRGLNI